MSGQDLGSVIRDYTTTPTGSELEIEADDLQVWAVHEWLDGVMPLPLDACSYVPTGSSSAIDWGAHGPPAAYANQEKRGA